MSVLNPMARKLARLHKDLWVRECIESDGEEIGKVR